MILEVLLWRIQSNFKLSKWNLVIQLLVQFIPVMGGVLVHLQTLAVWWLQIQVVEGKYSVTCPVRLIFLTLESMVYVQQHICEYSISYKLGKKEVLQQSH